jgi:archaellum component FlaC
MNQKLRKELDAGELTIHKLQDENQKLKKELDALKSFQVIDKDANIPQLQELEELQMANQQLQKNLSNLSQSFNDLKSKSRPEERLQIDQIQSQLSLELEKQKLFEKKFCERFLQIGDYSWGLLSGIIFNPSRA